MEITDVGFGGNDWVAFDALGGPLQGGGMPLTSTGEVRMRGESGAYLLRLSGFTGKITVERIEE